MTIYALQKAIRDINRNPDVRKLFMSSPESVAARYELAPTERTALVNREFGALYRMGVHGLLLRPFSILHSVSEQQYLQAIREVD